MIILFGHHGHLTDNRNIENRHSISMPVIELVINDRV